MFKTQNVEKAGKGKWQLFDLTKDQVEIIDLASQHPEIVKELSAVWDAWDKDVGVTSGYHAYWNKKAEKANTEKVKSGEVKIEKTISEKIKTDS
ncbi:MAG: hypothetical protein KAT00_01835, partial [Planctomycetes bacterium]|nr:hypothetical protein [Planctomycetota bacterium]